MSDVNLPADPDTRTDFDNFVLEENCDHIPIVALAVITQRDMIVMWPWCGIADQGMAIGAAGTLHVKRGILVRSSRIEAGSVFNLFGQEVWFNTVTREYTNTEADGLFLVGYVREVVNADGRFGFEKRRYVIDGEAT